MSEEKDFYRLLGVSRDAPDREIKKRYYELARKLHPDKARTPEDRTTNASQLAAISRAYNQLKDPKKRAEYDGQLRGRTAQSSGEVPTPGDAAAGRSATGSAAAAPSPPAGAPDNRASIVFQQRKSMAQKAFVRGMQHFKVQEFRQALSFFEAAVTNDPDSESQYHLKYAQCLMKTKGSFTKAVQHAEKACELDPYNMEFKMILAEINEMAGVFSRAKEIYEEVLRWDPTNNVARNSLNMLGGGGGAKGGTVLDKLSSLFGKKK